MLTNAAGTADGDNAAVSRETEVRGRPTIEVKSLQTVFVSHRLCHLTRPTLSDLIERQHQLLQQSTGGAHTSY